MLLFKGKLVQPAERSSCHPEQSEGSRISHEKIFRCVLDKKHTSTSNPIIAVQRWHYHTVQEASCLFGPFHHT